MRRKQTMIAFVLLIIMLVAGCTQQPTGRVVEEKEVKIGFIGPLSGFGAFAGEEMVRGMEIGLAEINQQGINGKELKVIYEDGQCFPNPAVNSFQKLTTVDNVPVIIGPACSTSILPVAPLANKAKIPIIGTIDASEDVDNAGEYVFSNGFLIEDGAKKIAEYAYNELGYRRISVLYDLDDWSKTMAEAFADEFKKKGGKIVTIQVHSSESKDYRTNIVKMDIVKPDAFYAIPLELDGLFIKQARELRIQTPILGADNFGIDAVIKGAGKAANGVIFSYQIKYTKDNQALEEFKEKYKQEYGDYPSNVLYAAMGYDNIHIVAEAIRQSGTNSEEIKQGLLNIKDFEGVLGTTSFDEKGNANREQHINKIENGEFVNIK